MTSKQAKEYLLRVRRAKREVQRYQALKARMVPHALAGGTETVEDDIGRRWD